MLIDQNNTIMKLNKIISFIFTLFVCSSIAAQRKGDVNVDGYVDISDVVSVINVIAGSESYKLNSDINSDKVTDISDVVEIINIIANDKSDEEPDAAVKAGLCPDNHHPHAIPIIIGYYDNKKFSCCNIGASAPWEYGSYYAWGETEEKDFYDWSTYTNCDGTKETCYELGSDIAGTQYDVATVKWGSKWRMPTLVQLKNLNSRTNEGATLNGVNGRIFTDYYGNSIFLPAAGYRWDDKMSDVENAGHYWSSTPYSNRSYYSYDNNVTLSYRSTSYHCRYYGSTIRPVTE